MVISGGVTGCTVLQSNYIMKVNESLFVVLKSVFSVLINGSVGRLFLHEEAGEVKPASRILMQWSLKKFHLYINRIGI